MGPDVAVGELLAWWQGTERECLAQGGEERGYGCKRKNLPVSDLLAAHLNGKYLHGAARLMK